MEFESELEIFRKERNEMEERKNQELKVDEKEEKKVDTELTKEQAEAVTGGKAEQVQTAEIIWNIWCHRKVRFGFILEYDNIGKREALEGVQSNEEKNDRMCDFDNCDPFAI